MREERREIDNEANVDKEAPIEIPKRGTILK